MGGIFGVCSKYDCAADLFFGTDYHSHLGAYRGGMAVFDGKCFARAIHNIENTPFRTKFEPDLAEMKGFAGVGAISDTYPQPIVINSKLGTFAVVAVGKIQNKKQLAERLIKDHNAYFLELSGGKINDAELVASLVCQKNDIAEGIAHAQDAIEGSMTMIICAEGGLYAARDKLGRTPLFVGKKEDGHCVSFESFAYMTLGYRTCRELGPGETVFVTADHVTPVAAPGTEMRMCSFLWTYYGYPTSDYEGQNVEEVRYRCGQHLAAQDGAGGGEPPFDYVAGIPDSGTAHAIGYANGSKVPFARPLIKYTPTWTRSFTPKDAAVRNLVARMKLIPVDTLIKNKRLLFVEDSIVRGTQMRSLMDFLLDCGAKSLHVRLGCPPVLYVCKYLNFTRSNREDELVSRQTIDALEGPEGENHISAYADRKSRQYRAMVESIRKSLNLESLEYLSLEGLLDSIGIDRCKLCTYCWNGKE